MSARYQAHRLLQADLLPPDVAGDVAAQPSFDDLVASLFPAPRVFRLRKGVRAAEIRHPARLWPQSVNAIYEALIKLSGQTFKADMDEFWRAEQRSGKFYGRERFVLLGDDDGNLIGWSSHFRVVFGGRECLHFEATSITAPFQRARLVPLLYRRMLAPAFLKHPFRTHYLVGITQSPSVYRLATDALGESNVFPQPGKPIPESVRRIAADCVRWASEWRAAAGESTPLRFDPDTSVFHGIMTGIWSPDVRPRPSGKPAIDDFFSSRLDWDDGLLIVLRASILGYLSFCARKARQLATGRRG